MFAGKEVARVKTGVDAKITYKFETYCRNVFYAVFAERHV